jgi:hypothetical protein
MALSSAQSSLGAQNCHLSTCDVRIIRYLLVLAQEGFPSVLLHASILRSGLTSFGSVVWGYGVYMTGKVYP